MTPSRFSVGISKEVNPQLDIFLNAWIPSIFPFKVASGPGQ